MRRVLVVLAVLGVCACAFVLAGASDEKSGAKTYKIMFDNAFGLTQGGDFRVGGVNAGQTTTFEVDKKKGESPKAIVTAEITKPGFGDFRKDASCEIRPQSLIGEYYVDCQPGKSDERLSNGGVVPVEQTSSTIPTDIVNNIMRRPYRERFRLIITELGTGLAGRPDDLQEVLRRAHPGLRETSKVLRILGDQNEVIKNFITDSDTVVAELENNKRDVVRWVRETGDAAEITATRRNELRANLRRFPEFLDELRPTMARLGELADEQTPLMADLNRAAPICTTLASLCSFIKLQLNKRSNPLETFIYGQNLTTDSTSTGKIISFVVWKQSILVLRLHNQSRISIYALPIYKEARRDRLYEALATLLPINWEEKVLNPDSDPESPVQDI